MQASKANTFGAMLVGAAAGAALGVLFAPKSGRETRRQLKDEAHDMKLRAKDKLESATSKASAGLEKAKEAKANFSEAVSEAARKTRRKADEAETTAKPEVRSTLAKDWDKEV